MKSNNRIKKALKILEVVDHKSWLGAHQQVFDFINILLKEEEDRVTKELYKETDYASANWELLKADQAGQLRLIKKLQSILED